CQASMTLQSMESGAFALVPPCQPICVSYPLFGSDGTRPNFRNYPSTGSESSVLISITDPTLALRILGFYEDPTNLPDPNQPDLDRWWLVELIDHIDNQQGWMWEGSVDERGCDIGIFPVE